LFFSAATVVLGNEFVKAVVAPSALEPLMKLLLPVTDLALVFETYFNLWDEATVEHITSLEKRKKEAILTVSTMRSLAIRFDSIKSFSLPTSSKKALSV
jgi:hypothetical protein